MVLEHLQLTEPDCALQRPRMHATLGKSVTSTGAQADRSRSARPSIGLGHAGVPALGSDIGTVSKELAFTRLSGSGFSGPLPVRSMYFLRSVLRNSNT